MKTKEQNFEKELPEGYRQIRYINAKQAKFGIIFNLIALAVLAVVMGVAFLTLQLRSWLPSVVFDLDLSELLVAYLIFFGGMIGYIILHELVHGIVYKGETGEKLTFGMSWSCAFCGVPHIYTYRRTALRAVAMPLIVFTALLVPILILLYFVSPLYYLIVAFLFGLHLGGCSGDVYVMGLLLFRYKNPKVLMRDTGPEQYFYVPEDAERIEREKPPANEKTEELK